MFEIFFKKLSNYDEFMATIEYYINASIYSVRRMDEKLPLFANGKCTINARARRRLSSFVPLLGGQQNF